MIKYETEHLWGDTYKVTKITTEEFFIRTDSPIKEITHKI